LTFGTGGIRGLNGVGSNRINRFTVRRVATGVAEYLVDQFGPPSEKLVVIGYDARRGSLAYAQEVYATLQYYGVPARIFKSYSTTPEVSFAVRYYKAKMGFMITASHNPPEYNGLKIYGEDGAQLPPDAGEAILHEMETLPCEVLLPSLRFNEDTSRYVDDACVKAYEDQLATLKNLSQQRNFGTPLTVVYTPLHGVGLPRVSAMSKLLPYANFHIVESQSNPDMNFTNTSSANPEDDIAFDRAILLAEDVNADLIIATDPDADRVGAMVRGHDGRFVKLTGNQTGALFTNFVIRQLADKRHLPLGATVVKSVVSTNLVNRICEAFDVNVAETLPGFKYIAEKIGEWEESGEQQFIYGFEESYGHLFGSFVRDKDAIQAAYMLCEMTYYYKGLGLTLVDALSQLRQEHGYYDEQLLNFAFKGEAGAQQMTALMNGLRQAPPQVLGGQTLVSWTDVASGTVYDATNEPVGETF
ncbi:MAG: phospho-sugar mutase, partial [Bacilli bacterium]